MPDRKVMRVGQIPLSDNYRQAVGPEDKYDLIGAHQFCVLVREGLREWHKLLDIGCGSLRGGRLFIPYLQWNGYYGTDPNTDLIDEALRNEIGYDITDIKEPSFVEDSEFRLLDVAANFWFMDDPAFDFILAQSIFSHSTQAQTATCIAEVAKVLKPTGKFLATFVKGSYNDSNSTWSRPIVYRTSAFFADLAKEHNLVYTELSDIKHPCGQTWFRMEREGEIEREGE